ncbi:MAG TPA: hypothetical protein VF120_11365 [Ktedonobacterales bacterium]
MPAAADTRNLDGDTRAFYCDALEVMNRAGVPFLIGGAYAFGLYTGIERHTKDFDLFLLPQDCEAALRAFAEVGYQTELSYPHWLGKVFYKDAFVDLIFSSGNGVAAVDPLWFRYASAGTLFDMPVRAIPAEEMIWSKAFVQERERFDGADVMHLLRARGAELDWRRLVARFGSHWRVLLSELVLFGFVYPEERDLIPRAVLDDLLARLAVEHHETSPQTHICRGTLLSREQYLVDVERWGYTDGREAPSGPMSAQDISIWTEAIEKSQQEGH